MNMRVRLEFEDYLEEELENQGIPGLGVLVFKAHHVLYEGYFGYANVENEEVLESHHSFLLASVSKMVTATALLQLYDKNLFDMDDPINDYLPFDVYAPGYEDIHITFRMLLMHTAGIADGAALDDQYYYGEDSPVDLTYFLENYLVEGGQFYDAADNFTGSCPGEKHEYSNEGSALIGVLVEQLSGQSFDGYCHQHIFEPLGMNYTSWRLDELEEDMIVMPYELDEQEEYKEIGHYTFTDYPNGGLRSSLLDLAYFFEAFVQKGKAGGYELLSATTMQEMLTVGIADQENEVGLHVFKMDENLWGHDGSEQGTSTCAVFDPNSQIGAIVLANIGDVDVSSIAKEAYAIGAEL